MARIDLRPTDVRVAVGLDAKQVSVLPRSLRSQNETMTLIWDAVRDAGWMSRLQICRAVDRQKTQWLIGLIERMVDQGYLIRVMRPHLNGALMYTYELPVGEG